MSAHVQRRVATSRPRQERRPLTVVTADRPGVLAPAPILYGGAFLVGALLHGFFPRPLLPLGMSPPAGFALLCAGVVLAVWSRRTMESTGTNVNPSRPATTLVTIGPYAFSRNPMYVARTCLYLGLGLLMNALCVLVAVVPLLVVMHYGVIKPEERYLEAKFGEAYRQYRSHVRRWL